MDEPTTHLDEQRRKELVNILSSFFREGGRIIPQMLIITHHTEIEDVADTIYNFVASVKEEFTKEKLNEKKMESEKLVRECRAGIQLRIVVWPGIVRDDNRIYQHADLDSTVSSTFLEFLVDRHADRK